MTKTAPEAGQGAASALASRLKSIDGFALDEALEMALGRIEFLEKMLRMFLATHADDAAGLRQLHADGDHAGVGRVAHGLKGAAATIGAGRLARLASEVQTAARERGKVSAGDVTGLVQESERFCAALRAALDPPRDA